jgi:hypothetical protein
MWAFADLKLSVRALLPVNIHIAVVELCHSFSGDLVGLAQLQREVDRFCHILDHDRGFDRAFCILAHGKDAVIFEQHCGTGADMLHDLLADLLTPNQRKVRAGDSLTELVSVGSQVDGDGSA